MPNNMGMVRYILAFAVLVAHFKLLVGADFYFPLSSHNAVGGFFALSGFLMYGSYLRKKSVRAFIKSRALRLLPPYCSVVLSCAVGLAAVSTYGAAEYFGSAYFWKYLAANLGFMNFLQPDLPGVFDSLPIHAVDGSLWTMKIDWLLYLSVIPTVWLVSRVRRHKTMVFAAIYVLSATYSVACLTAYEHTGREIWNIMQRQVFGQISYFYVGVFIYYRLEYMLRYRWTVLACACAIYVGGMWAPAWLKFFIDPVCVSTLAIWLSMALKRIIAENRLPNLSYSIYIVHWPVFQLTALYGLKSHMGPNLTFIVTVAVIVLLSALINIGVEKPVHRYFKARGKTVEARAL